MRVNSSDIVTAYSLSAYQRISYRIPQNVFGFREASLPNSVILHNCHPADYTECIKFLLELHLQTYISV